MGRLASRQTAYAAAAAAVLLFAAGGCGERGEPTGPASSLYPITVTSGDKPLVVPEPARRIAVIALSVRSIIVDLGAGGRIVGTPIAPNGTVRTAELRSLHPDVVVASSTTDDSDLRRAAEGARGVPLYVAPDDSIRGVVETITELGLITNEPVAARRLVHEIDVKRRLVDAKLAGRPSVSVFVDVGFFTTVSDQSLIGDLLREAHASNVAGSTLQVGPFDLRELLRLQPRFYLATSDSGTTLATLRKNPQTRKLKAIRAHRFAVVDVRLLEPGPAIGEGLVELARLLHPNALR